ncbi:MAG: single-strand DNA-binding protein [Sphingobacteriales bacterium]|jgi:single-strand DNA-binding protein
MSSLNKVMLIGHLGKDPEVRHLENGASVANFTIATTETFTDKEGKRTDKTEWHNIVVWRKLAEIAEKYLTKGKLVYIEGKLRTRSWDDKEGNKRYTTEIFADTFTMLGKRDDNQGGGGGFQGNQTQDGVPQAAAATPASNSSSSEGDDDLPF